MAHENKKEEGLGTRNARELLDGILSGSGITMRRESDGQKKIFFEIRTAEGKQEKIFAEIIGRDKTLNKKYAEEVAKFRKDIFNEWGQADATEDVEAAFNDIENGTVDIILLRNSDGKAIGYIETELFSLEPSSGNARSFMFDWIVGVKLDYRGNGLAQAMYFLAGQEALERAQKESSDIVAFAATPLNVGDESFTRGIAPTYPFFRDESGNLVELVDIEGPNSAGTYSGSAQGKPVRWMIRFTDDRHSTESKDVLEIMNRVNSDFVASEDEVYASIVQDIKSFTEAVLKKSLDGKIIMVSGEERKKITNSNKTAVFEMERFAEWLQRYPDLLAQYLGIISATEKYNQTRA